VLPLTTTKTTRVKADPIYMDNMKVSFSHGQSFECRHYCQSPIQFIYSLLPSSPCYQPYTILLFGFTTILKTILMLHLKCIVWSSYSLQVMYLPHFTSGGVFAKKNDLLQIMLNTSLKASQQFLLVPRHRHPRYALSNKSSYPFPDCQWEVGLDIMKSSKQYQLLV
jgi:hypothetical protein